MQRLVRISLLGRFAFALEESAGDAARRVGVLAVIDGQRQEVDALTRGGRMAGGDEHHRVALPDDDGSVRLLGQLACLDRQVLLADLNLTLVHKASMGSRSPVCMWSQCGSMLTAVNRQFQTRRRAARASGTWPVVSCELVTCGYRAA